MTTTTDAGLLHTPDIARVAFALREGRVIFTEDDDFLLLSARGVAHAGIIYARQQTRTIGEIVAALFLAWQVYDPGEVARRVEYL